MEYVGMRCWLDLIRGAGVRWLHLCFLGGMRFRLPSTASVGLWRPDPWVPSSEPPLWPTDRMFSAERKKHTHNVAHRKG